MTNFWQRTLTGAAYVLIVVGSILWSFWSFYALLLVFCILGLREYALLFKGKEYAPSIPGTVILGLIYFLAGKAGEVFPPFPIYILLFIPFIIELYRKKEMPFQRACIAVAGIIYIAQSLLFFFYFFNNRFFGFLL